jgi:hypothetical protein
MQPKNPLTPTLSPSDGAREKIGRYSDWSPNSDGSSERRTHSLSPSDGESFHDGYFAHCSHEPLTRPAGHPLPIRWGEGHIHRFMETNLSSRTCFATADHRAALQAAASRQRMTAWNLGDIGEFQHSAARMAARRFTDTSMYRQRFASRRIVTEFTPSLSPVFPL